MKVSFEEQSKCVRSRSHTHSVQVASPGIEPGSWAPETHILSIVLRGRCKGKVVSRIISKKGGELLPYL